MAEIARGGRAHREPARTDNECLARARLRQEWSHVRPRRTLAQFDPARSPSCGERIVHQGREPSQQQFAPPDVTRSAVLILSKDPVVGALLAAALALGG